MQQQVQRTRTTQPVEHVEAEQPERDARADDVSEQAECCLADIDAVIEEACCLLAEVVDVVDSAPTESEFKAEYYRLRDAYWAAEIGSVDERETESALNAYRAKWPQFDHLCTC